MGGGILPVAYHKGKIKFLFSREALHGDEDPGKWSDFGGGKEGRETPYQTAVREGWEESSGFLGSKQDIRNLIRKHKLARIVYSKYTTYIVEIPFNANLPREFSAHFKKNKKERPDLVYDKNGLFEKDKLMWLSLDKLRENIYRFRPFYKKIVRYIIKECT